MAENLDLDYYEKVFNGIDPDAAGEDELGHIGTVPRGLEIGVKGLASGVGSATRWMGDLFELPPVSKAGDVASDHWDESIKGLMPRGPSFEGTFAENPTAKKAILYIAQAVPSLAAAMTTGAAGMAAGMSATGASILAAGGLGMLEGAPQYEEARDAGKSIEEATNIGAAATVGTAILEFLPISSFLKGIKGGRMTRLLKGGVTEAGQEATQTLWQNMVAKYGYDKTRSLAEGIIESAIGGFGAGGMTGVVFEGVEDQDLLAAKEDIDKQLVDTATRISDTMTGAKESADVTTRIQAIVRKIKAGNTNWTEQELQDQANHPDEVERLLSRGVSYPEAEDAPDFLQKAAIRRQERIDNIWSRLKEDEALKERVWARFNPEPFDPTPEPVVEPAEAEVIPGEYDEELAGVIALAQMPTTAEMLVGFKALGMPSSAEEAAQVFQEQMPPGPAEQSAMVFEGALEEPAYTESDLDAEAASVGENASGALILESEKGRYLADETAGDEDIQYAGRPSEDGKSWIPFTTQELFDFGLHHYLTQFEIDKFSKEAEDAPAEIEDVEGAGEASTQDEEPTTPVETETEETPPVEFKKGDWITDGLVRGKITGTGTITNQNIPVYKVDFGDGETGVIIKDQAEPFKGKAETAEEEPQAASEEAPAEAEETAKEPWQITLEKSVEKAYPPGKDIPIAPDDSVADLNGQEAKVVSGMWQFKAAADGQWRTVTDPVTRKRLDHQWHVAEAVKAGKDVPAEVLAEYPDLTQPTEIEDVEEAGTEEAAEVEAQEKEEAGEEEPAVEAETDEQKQVPTEGEAWVPPAGVAKIEKELKRLNKKAKRLGMEPLEVEWGESRTTHLVTKDTMTSPHSENFFHEKKRVLPEELEGYKARGWDYSGVVVEERHVKIVGKVPKIKGWSFVATLDHLEEGNIIRGVPGEDLPKKYRDADNNCDHCGYNRRRKKTYVLRNADGDHKQIGSTCIKDFLGTDNAEKMAQRAEMMGQLMEFINVEYGGDAFEDEFGGGVKRGSGIGLDWFLPRLAALVRQDGFLSRKEADMDGSMPTSEAAASDQNKIKVTDEDKATAEKALEWAQGLSEQDEINDFEHNLTTLAQGAAVDPRHVELASWIVMGYTREKLRQEARRDKKPSEWQGEVAVRSDFAGLTVQRVVPREGLYGTTYWHLLEDRKGNVFTWVSSRHVLETGQTYDVRATVKEHTEWKGIKQTVLTRAKAEEAAPVEETEEIEDEKKAGKPVSLNLLRFAATWDAFTEAVAEMGGEISSEHELTSTSGEPRKNFVVYFKDLDGKGERWLQYRDDGPPKEGGPAGRFVKTHESEKYIGPPKDESVSHETEKQPESPMFLNTGYTVAQLEGVKIKGVRGRRRLDAMTALSENHADTEALEAIKKCIEG